MVIGVIGGDGFVGSNIVKSLKKLGHIVYSINRKDYNNFIGFEFDFLINANSNSKKYLAENDPNYDFDASVKSVFNSIFEFKFKHYILISSIDALVCDSIYGANKYLAESILYSYSSIKSFKYNILECASIIGKDAKKGIVYDILNNNKLRLSAKSSIYVITIDEIINRIIKIISKNNCDIYNHLWSKNTITVEKIGKILNKRLQYINNPNEYIYPKLGDIGTNKTSEYYIKRMRIK